MDINKWLTFLSALLFLEASPSAEACTCARGHLQQAFCRSAAVLKVQFIKASMPDPTTSNNDTFSMTGYKIRTLKVLKGNAKWQNLTFIRSMAGSTCEYHHPEDAFNIDYLIAVSRNEKGLSVNLCSFKSPWSKLSPEQIRGIQGRYLHGCTCDIVSCFYKPCSSTIDRCVFEDYDGGDSQYMHEDQMCARNAAGVCSWEEMK